MESDRLQFFRDLIHQEITELSIYQVKTMTEMIISTERLPDFIDHTATQSDRNLELKIRDRERKLIAKMEEAILRIDQGTYGTCSDCGEEISEKRLIARPVTTLCIDCKTKQEKYEKMRGEVDSSAFLNNFSESFRYRQEKPADFENAALNRF